MTNIRRTIAAAGLALAMVLSLPAAAAPRTPANNASCRSRPCGPQICMDIGTCPSPKPPTV